MQIVKNLPKRDLEVLASLKGIDLSAIAIPRKAIKSMTKMTTQPLRDALLRLTATLLLETTILESGEVGYFLSESGKQLIPQN